MTTTHDEKQEQKRAGLKVRTDIRAGAYFSITFGAGLDSAGAEADTQSQGE